MRLQQPTLHCGILLAIQTFASLSNGAEPSDLSFRSFRTAYFPIISKNALQVVTDSNLTAQQKDGLQKRLLEDADRINSKLQGPDARSIATTELVDPLRPILLVIQKELADPQASHLLMAQCAIEAQFIGIAALSPKSAANVLRNAVVKLGLTKAQSEKIESVLKTLDESITAELAKSGEVKKNDLAELDQLQMRLMPLSAKAWTDIRETLTIEQRQSLAKNAH